jgi:hypothetical protein
MEITETTWIAINSFATCALALGTAVLAIGVPWSLWRSRVEARHRSYLELDRIYLDIQKLVIQMPYLTNPESLQTPQQLLQYDAFAFVTWNFIESIYDYSVENKRVLDTWKCIYLYESTRHREWFNKLENRPKFKTSFVRCIENGAIK